jgi:ribose transport system substrate-binding protein
MLSAKRANIAVKALKGDWTEEGGYRAVSAWLRLSISKELHLRVIGCQNDAMALGARLAIQEIADNDERQKLLELPFTGCDGLPNKGQAFVDRGVLRATVVNPPLTGPALQMLAHAFAAKAQPAEHTLVSVSSYPPVEALRLKGTPA